MRRYCFIIGLLLFTSLIASSQSSTGSDESWILTSYLQKAYPEKSFIPIFDRTKSLWSLLITAHDKATLLYWKDGRLLPEQLIQDFASYDPVFSYTYADAVKDPETFSLQEIESLRKLAETRSNGEVKEKSINFLLDALYDGKTENEVLKHIIQVEFLGRKIIIHEDILPAVKRVQTRLTNEAKTDEAVKKFLESLGNISGYNWRDIRDVSARSTHSWGISIDILPKKMNVYEIYWMWTKDINEENWMLTPLKLRWIPPSKVLSVFEEEGFVWGGKWLIWDNMHFEYRPDILLYSEK